MLIRFFDELSAGTVIRIVAIERGVKWASIQDESD